MTIYTDTLTPGVYRIDYTKDDFGNAEMQITSDVEHVADLPGLLMEVEGEDDGIVHCPRVLLLGNVIQKCDCKTKQISDKPLKFLHTFSVRTS